MRVRQPDAILTVTWPRNEGRTFAARAFDLLVGVPFLIVTAILLNIVLAAVGMSEYAAVALRRLKKNGALTNQDAFDLHGDDPPRERPMIWEARRS